MPRSIENRLSPSRPCARRRGPEAARRAAKSSTRPGKLTALRAGRAPRRSRARSRRSTRSSSTAAATSGWTTPRTRSRATASSRASVRVEGRPVFVFAQDFTVFGGSLSETNAAKICKVMDLAMKVGAPVVGPQRLGRRAHPGRRRLARRLRGHLPAQHARLAASSRRSRAILGPCAGGAVYSPAITDFVLMVRGHELDVRDRARTSSRPSRTRTSRRRRSAAPTRTRPSRASRTSWRTRTRTASRRSATLLVVPSVEQPRGPADAARTAIPRTARIPSWTISSRPRRTSRTT